MIIQLSFALIKTRKNERGCAWFGHAPLPGVVQQQHAVITAVQLHVFIKCAARRPSSLFIRRPAVCFHESRSVRSPQKQCALSDHGARSTRIRSYYWNQTCSCVSADRLHVTMGVYIHVHGVRSLSLIICKCDRRVFYYVRARWYCVCVICEQYIILYAGADLNFKSRHFFTQLLERGLKKINKLVGA
jgi:hypothetical protein